MLCYQRYVESNSKQPLKLVVFDLDGTLVELELEHFAQQIELTLGKVGLYSPPREKLLELVHKHDVNSLFTSVEETKHFWNNYEDGEIPPPRLFERSLSTVEEVVARGLDVAIATARKYHRDELRRVLQHTGLMKHIDIVSTWHGENWLDKVEQLRKLCKDHLVEPRRCTMVGDTEDDMRSSRSVGFGLRLAMNTGITPVARLQVHKPHRILSCIGEVPPTLDEHSQVGVLTTSE